MAKQKSNFIKRRNELLKSKGQSEGGPSGNAAKAVAFGLTAQGGRDAGFQKGSKGKGKKKK
jgi:hypothetical protein